MAEYANLRQSYQFQSRVDPLQVSIDSFNSQYFSQRNDAFTRPEESRKKADQLKVFALDVIAELNIIQDKIDNLLYRKLSGQIYSKKNQDGFLLQKVDAYASCLKI